MNSFLLSQGFNCNASQQEHIRSMARWWQQLRPIQVNVLTMTTIESSETTRIRGFKNTRFTDGKPADQKRQEIGQFDDSVWALLRMIDEFLPVEVRDPNIELSRFSNKKFLWSPAKYSWLVVPKHLWFTRIVSYSTSTSWCCDHPED